ncbi:hypothetical protein TSUD_315650 [Trifolium subterraneum]|uniref:CSC1/OSCA1-like 7TM region domain-containing protein n=1 Tax=Trifolium subterraneum TaxID=3900 RepID=A0A2Z6MH85_TRISU|nr:hypothetical protein TSUD_315650 [Trifolium subterraneum]
MAARNLQSANPMLWVTDQAPEPRDVYWSNLCIPYHQLWIRKIFTWVASITFVLVFLIPVTFTQGMTQLEKLEKMFPFLTDIVKKSFMAQLVTGYLPSVILVTFFTTYVLSSGWAALGFEIMQPSALFWNWFQRLVLCSREDTYNGFLRFPYHTEVPRVLLFGFLGFTCSILAPLILPFLLFYFFLAYIVYRNQILNVYITKYDGGGQFWPIAHNTIIFSMLVAQVIALGVFGQKRSTIASGFTIPLLIGTVLFNEYCRQRFLPVFKNDATQILIDMDTRDKNCGRMGEIYDQLHAAYCQFKNSSTHPERFSYPVDKERVQRLQSQESLETGKNNIQAISWPHR